MWWMLSRIRPLCMRRVWDRCAIWCESLNFLSHWISFHIRCRGRQTVAHLSIINAIVIFIYMCSFMNMQALLYGVSLIAPLMWTFEYFVRLVRLFVICKVSLRRISLSTIFTFEVFWLKLYFWNFCDDKKLNKSCFEKDYIFKKERSTSLQFLI